MSHPVEDVLVRYSVGDLPPTQLETVRAHVVECAACGKTLADLESERQSLLARRPAAAMFVDLEARRFAERRRRVVRFSAGATSLFAAAAALFFFIGPIGHHSGNGIKGGGLSVYVKRGDAVHLLAPEETIAAGDALRVVVTLDRQRVVRTWSIDDEGRVDALMPAARAVGPGTVDLEGSAVVESPCVPGWLVVAVGDAAQRTPDTNDRARSLTKLSEGGYTQRLTCETR